MATSAQIVQRTQSPFGTCPMAQQGEATGSGFVIDKDGDILTNAHVVAAPRRSPSRSATSKTVTAKVVGKDVSDDLALLKVDPTGLNLQPLALGDAPSRSATRRSRSATPSASTAR